MLTVFTKVTASLTKLSCRLGRSGEEGDAGTVGLGVEGVKHRAVEVVRDDGRVAAVPPRCVLLPRPLLAPAPPTSRLLPPPAPSVPDHLTLVVATHGITAVL